MVELEAALPHAAEDGLVDADPHLLGAAVGHLHALSGVRFGDGKPRHS